MKRSLCGAVVLWLTAVLGCRSDLSLYNPDGSINTLNQVEMLRRNYIRMNASLLDADFPSVARHMVTVEQLATLLPEIPNSQQWTGAREMLLKNLDNMKAALRIGDTFAAKDFCGKAGAAVQMIWTLAPVLFQAGMPAQASPEKAPETGVPAPQLPVRPPGLYDN